VYSVVIHAQLEVSYLTRRVYYYHVLPVIPIRSEAKRELSSAEEFYDVDLETGIIVNKRSGKRSFVLGVKEWNSLIEKLYETFGSAGEVILFQIGKSYGSSALEEEREMNPDRELTINLLSTEARVAGWGKVSVEKRKSPEYYTVKAERCVFCSGSRQPVHRDVGCFFLKGVIAGFAEVLFSNSSNRVEETHCRRDYCEFNVTLNAS
jgi:predicted hydrocarbon binding protein